MYVNRNMQGCFPPVIPGQSRGSIFTGVDQPGTPTGYVYPVPALQRVVFSSIGQEYRYAGCFRDQDNPYRVLTGGDLTHFTTMSIEKCLLDYQGQNAGQGFPFVGAEYGTSTSTAEISC